MAKYHFPLISILAFVILLGGVFYGASVAPIAHGAGYVSFDTPPHAYPQVDFNYDPANPMVKSQTHFQDASTCYNAVGQTGCSSWSWDFGRGTGTGSAPTFIYPLPAPTAYPVIETVTDNNGNSCGIAKYVSVGSGTTTAPTYKEVPPQ